MNINISIADDHPIVVEGLRKVLEKQAGLKVIASYLSGKALLEGLQAQQPDVLLLDIRFPDTTGNELARTILPLYPLLKILVITSVDDPFDVRDMMRLGCSGYVQKTIHPHLLVEAIETVHAGGKYLQPSLREGVIGAMLRPRATSVKDILLTVREREVLELISEGLTNSDIGARLHLSHRTIENHRVSLYQKFGVNNAVSLVKLAVQHRLVQ